MSEMNMSYSFEPRYDEASTDFKKTSQEIKNEKNNIDTFEKFIKAIYLEF